MIVERLTKKVADAVVFPAELVGVTLTPDNAILNAILTRLAAYEDTDLRPEDCVEYQKFEDELLRFGCRFGHVLDLLAAERDGRLVIKRPITDKCCGSCHHFLRLPKTASGSCEVRKLTREPFAGQPLSCSQSRKACVDYEERGEREPRFQEA